MSRREYYLSALLPSLVALPAVAQQQEKPNIVVIVADDMGTNEIGCYGGQNLATPNIDRLASEGIRMTNNYASMAMSVPIRRSTRVFTRHATVRTRTTRQPTAT